MEQFAQLIGRDTLTAGWAVWLGQGVVFGVGFALVVARTINPFTHSVIAVSRKSTLAQKLLVPLLHRSALGVTASSMGFIYGQVVLTPLYAYLAPVVLGLQGVPVEIPLATVPVILGYIVYGQVMGLTYGTLLETTWFDFHRFGDEHRAALVGAVAGGIAGVGVLAAVGGPELLIALGELVGEASVRRGVLLFLAVAVGFGLLFAGVLARTINDFTNTVIMFSRRSPLTQKILVPLLTRAALTVTAGSIGLFYGLLLGVAVVALGVGGVIPRTGPAGLLSFTVYGYVLGSGYGMLMETIDLSGLAPSQAHRAGFVGSIGAGLLSAGFIALALGPSVFGEFAALTGATERIATLVGSVDRVAGLVWLVDPVVGVALWMSVAVVLGLVFVTYVSRTINDFTNTVIMFSRRSTLTQKILVPLLSRAALTVTAGSMGLLYGLLLGVAVIGLGTAGVIPQTGLAGLLACTIYGNLLGYGYGLLMEDVDLSGLGPSEEHRAGFVGSIGAGLLSAGFIALTLGPSVFSEFAALTGSVEQITALVGSVAPISGVVGFVEPVVGVTLWMGVAVVFGLVFVTYVSRTINDFTNTVIMFSRRSTLTQKILVPLLSRAALTVTAGSMGLLYGLALGVAAYGGVLMGVLPQASPLLIVAFVVYGHALGTSYGLQLEDVDLSLPATFSRNDRASQQSIRLIEIDYDWFRRWSIRSDDTASQQSVRLIEIDYTWFDRRPTRGAALLFVGGSIMAVLSLLLVVLSESAGPSPAALGIVFGTMIVTCGGFALAKPDLSTVIGVTGVSLSILSIIGAFGGLFIGMVVGFVGGTLCIVWEAPTESSPTSDGEFGWVGDGDQQLGD